MTTEKCIAAGIWDAAIEAGDDLNTAQGRAALDRRLRTALDGIEDEHLRQHATDMLRKRRHLAFRGVPFDMAVSLAEDLRAMIARVEAIEAFLSLPFREGHDTEVCSLRPPRSDLGALEVI